MCKLLRPLPMTVPERRAFKHAILPSRALKATAFIVLVRGGNDALWTMHILIVCATLYQTQTVSPGPPLQLYEAPKAQDFATE
ncbi:hypothetical protein F52700_12409 [Fusarium sp. NRRL 52700]|nr:hypothetical protein F52700_12409 [Fusarium sp. NRRL 52700]